MGMTAVVISITTGISELGLVSALVQMQALRRDEIARVSGALFAANVACAACLVVAAPVIAEALGVPELTPLIRVSSLQLLLGALEAVPQALLKRDMNFR